MYKLEPQVCRSYCFVCYSNRKEVENNHFILASVCVHVITLTYVAKWITSSKKHLHKVQTVTFIAHYETVNTQ